MRKNSTRIVLVAGLMFLYTNLLAATFTVTNLNDSGPGSLRQALIDASFAAGPDDIVFNIDVASLGSSTISLVSPLNVNSPVNINGYSQSGAVPGQINSPSRAVIIGIFANGGDAFLVNSGNVTITGLAVYGADRAFLVGVQGGVGGTVRISGNNIGFDENGSGSLFLDNNDGVFVDLENGSLTYANPRVVIGTNGDGVGDANEGNLISNNANAGVFLSGADNCVVAGNYIGTNINGGGSVSFTLSNGTGIILDGLLIPAGCVGNRIGTNGDGVSDVLERNIISLNKQNGILITKLASGNIVAGNFIGLNTDGNPGGNRGNTPFTAGGVNNGNGILLSEASNNIIGISPTGGSAVQANYISANAQNGITITSFSAVNASVGNTIMGNVIGTNLSNAGGLGNIGWGVLLANLGAGNVNDNIIGSNDDGNNDALEANTIVNNRKDGIAIREAFVGNTRRNRISRNTFSGNTGASPFDGQGFGLSINLQTVSTDGITVNDPGDPDAGGNELFNYPEFTSFGVDAGMARFTGTTPAGSTVQLYLATSAADAAIGNPNYREGATFLGNFLEGGPEDQDPAPGAFLFFVGQSRFTQTVAAGAEVVATAISTVSGLGNTSEFSMVTLSILPVQFVSFDAQLQGEKVLVTWATAQEQNASHFEVQKSTNGTTFQTIGSVNARGNSTTLVNYSFTDNSVAPGVSYYRLRQVDLDGKFVYTKVVTIRNQGKGTAFYAWPNPVNDVLNLTLNQTKPERLQIRVVDMNGRTMRANEFNTVRGLNQISLNFSSLPRGMYMIQVTGGETVLTQKIMKN